MAQAQIRHQTKSKNWTINSRFKVGQTVTYNNYIWINTTGANSEPTDTNVDWLKHSFVGVINDPSVIPLGKIKRFKAPGNSDIAIWESGDFGYGFTSDGAFLKPGVYVAGDPLLFSSWSDTDGDFITQIQ